MSDPVNKPTHYTSHPSGVECWTIAEHFSFALGQVIKYVWRAGLKSADPIQDLEKAHVCLGREIERLKREKASIDDVAALGLREGSLCAKKALPGHVYLNGACVACGVKT